ncbi:MAG: lysine 2,3-aminomutase [Nitrospirota bacterium]|nr:MAG: lysine 2,3-aminomutase [Nitrospirota bacterium]
MTEKYRAYTLRNFREMPQAQYLSDEQIFDIEVVGQVFPFKTNNYVVDNLIEWDNIPHDPMFVLTFPQKGMLKKSHYDEMAGVIRAGSDPSVIIETADRIRWQLNPHPAGQIEHNIPEYCGEKLEGMQHKYQETVLFFPNRGQTCHAFCTFCFRWPQFVGIEELKFAMKEVEPLIGYIREHQEVTDLLYTGGDPMVMRTKNIEEYIRPVLDADIHHLKSIRIGTKALSYWPDRFVNDFDSDDLLFLFRDIVRSGRHLSIMAHFNHPNELITPEVREAIKRIKGTGAEIRTQTPLLRHINDDPRDLAEMWREQVALGCVPYYLFVVRDTGAQHYFGVPLVRAWEIYRDAYKNVSGLARTVRGPSMSAGPGKVQVLGVEEIYGSKVMVLDMLQGRDPNWVKRPFFAKYDEDAMWLEELKPAFGAEKFFFEEEFFSVR